MHIAALKSHQLLPLPESINPYFTFREGFFEPDTLSRSEYFAYSTLFNNGFAFINAIRIRLEDHYTLSALRFIYLDDDYEEVQYTKKTIHNNQTVFIWEPSKVIRKIELVDGGVMAGITGIEVTGRSVEDIQELFDTLNSSYDQIQNEWETKLKENQDHVLKIKTLDAEYEELDDNINNLKGYFDSLNAQVRAKEKKREILVEREHQSKLNLKQLEEKYDSEVQAVADLSDAKESLDGQVREIKKEKEALIRELDKLKLEKFRYSEDFDSFKRELSLQNMLFLGLITFFFIVGGAIVHSLLTGSYELLRSFNSGVNIYELIVSRIPSVALHSLIVFFVSKWLGVLINALISNLDDLKRLKKLVYLVTEVTESQAIGLPESNDPNARYKQRVTEKMSIVRDALQLDNAKNTEDLAKGKAKELSEAAGNTLRVIAGR